MLVIPASGGGYAAVEGTLLCARHAFSDMFNNFCCTLGANNITETFYITFPRLWNDTM
jgi:hypothetical protein